MRKKRIPDLHVTNSTCERGATPFPRLLHEAGMLGRQSVWDDDWEDMPIEHSNAPLSVLDLSLDSDDLSDEGDNFSPATKRAVKEARVMRARREYMRGRGSNAVGGTSNLVGEHIDVHDVRGYDWRKRPDVQRELEDSLDEPGYTQMRLDEDEEEEQLHVATDYLFQEDLHRIEELGDDPTAAPISQLAMTKRLLSEAQKFAYLGLCSTIAHQMLQDIQRIEPKDAHFASQSADEWLIRVMIRLYQHLDIDPREQVMIESLSQHGIQPSDLAPSLVTTHTIPNPGYDPSASQKEPLQEKVESVEANAEYKSKTVEGPEVLKKEKHGANASKASSNDMREKVEATQSQPDTSAPAEPNIPASTSASNILTDPNTAAQMADKSILPRNDSGLPAPAGDTPDARPTLQGVTTEINESSKTITLDIRWTVLCDLFLVLTADSVYDARSRVLLERIAEALGLTWMDVTKFEKRITDSLEIEEDVQTLDNSQVTQRHERASRNKRLLMMGIATLGGGLVIGLSAGLLAPVIGAGIGAALGTVGIGGTSTFLGSVGGAAIITTTGTVGGATMGVRGMGRRMRSVKTFIFRPLHTHKRVNCIVTVPGFLKGPEDDPTLPYSVLDPVMGDAFSIMWEPEMMRDMGNAMSILWNETLVQGVQQVLAATVAGAMFSGMYTTYDEILTRQRSRGRCGYPSSATWWTTRGQMRSSVHAQLA